MTAAGTTGALDTGEAVVRYRLDGPPGAPVLVLSNSLGTTSALWDPQINTFVQRFRVLRYEHRGHAGSPAPPGPYSIGGLASDVVALLDGLGLERASVCGLSLGAMVAMRLATQAPERIEGLVICAGAPCLPPPEQWEARADAVRRQGTGHLLEGLVGRWFTAAFAAARPDAVALVADMLGQTDPEGYAGCCEAIAATDQREPVAHIAVPPLVIGGADDPVVPPATALETAGAIPHSSLLVLAPSAHLVNMEQPERFAIAVRDHLLGPPGRRGDQVRRAVLGDPHVDRASSAATAFTAPFQELITRYAWGDVWDRPGLDRRSRSCITLAMLVSLGRFDELALHVRGALRNGLSRDEIGEVLLQTAVYCGVPAANSAFAVARRALDEVDDG